MKTIKEIIQEGIHNDIILSYGRVVYINNNWVFVHPGKQPTAPRVERVRQTDLGKKLAKINADEQYLEKLKKFLLSEKGQKMVNCIDHAPITVLIKRFEAPDARHRHKPREKYNLFKAAMKLAKVTPFFEDTHIVDYTHLLYNKQLKGELKPHPSLSKYEMKHMNKLSTWDVKRDKTGNPIIKTDDEGKLLYDAVTNIPFYRYTPKPKGLGEALRMHLLEMHKMDKWDTLHPKPTETELKEDLFPAELLSGHRTARYLHLESVREFLAHKYCHSIRKTPTFRVFEVYKTSSALNNCCEVERYEDAYCLVGLSKNTSNITLKNKLENHLAHTDYTPMGENTIAYKIYDNEGNLRIRVDCAA